nr:hypothetical protein [Mucilaginibacter sp. X4EP1]
MNPFQIRERILQLLSDKIESGEETNITKDDLNHITFVYADNNGDVGMPTITSDIKSKITDKTIKEIESIRQGLST